MSTTDEERDEFDEAIERSERAQKKLDRVQAIAVKVLQGLLANPGNHPNDSDFQKQLDHDKSVVERAIRIAKFMDAPFHTQ